MPPSAPPPPGDDVADLVARCILALETEGRDAVDALLAAEPELAERAREQLESLENAGLLMEREFVPEQIGGYRIRSVIGRGGMGEVYLAEQSEPVQRRVAIKVIRPGMDTREVLARFAVERQALALFDHPNIAKVYDAGTTDDGRPFLVMEYVDGTPITEYCDVRQLTVADRVALLAEVCETVQHAHQRGVLHRDLKPSNILVSDRDGRPWPKVIDFGVAKSTQHRLALETLYTERGQVLGTPEYMSPEQAAHRLDVDTRTDVYSLGCILYELLTGCLPVASERLREGGSDLSRLLQETPASPSARVRSVHDANTAGTKGLFSNRRTDATGLRRQLHRDLDWITMCALDRDRNRRYRTPADLAEDLRRHLRNEAVHASPPSAMYRMQRFFARHRVATTAGTVTLGALITGLTLSLIAFGEADARARDATKAQADTKKALARAEDRRREADSARQLAEENFFAAIEAATELLIRTGGERLRRFPELEAERTAMLESGLETCRSLLERNGSGPRFAVLRAKILGLVGSFSLELNRPNEALTRAEEAMAALTPAENDATFREEWLFTAHSIAVQRKQALSQLGRTSERTQAARDQQRWAQLLAAEFPNRPGVESLVRGARNTVLINSLADNEERSATLDLLEASLETLRSESKDENLSTEERVKSIELIASLGRGRMIRGKVKDALPLLEEARKGVEALLAAEPDNVQLIESLGPIHMQRGSAFQQMRATAAAETAVRKAIDVYERLRLRYPSYTLYLGFLAAAHQQLGTTLSGRFAYSEALDALRAAVDLRRQICQKIPESDRAGESLARSLADYVLIGADRRQLTAGFDTTDIAAACEESIALADKLIGKGRINLTLLDIRANMTYSRARLLELEGKIEAATPYFASAVEHKNDVVARFPGRVSLVASQSVVTRKLAETYVKLGRAEDALAPALAAVSIEEGLAKSAAGFRNGAERMHLARTATISAYAALGQQDKAIEQARFTLDSEIGSRPVTLSQILNALMRGARVAADDSRTEVLTFAREIADRHDAELSSRFGATGGAMYHIMAARAYLQAANVESLLGDRGRERQELEAAKKSWDAVLATSDKERYREERGAVTTRLTALDQDGQARKKN